jgi:heat-inducible transcriptional repressor
LEDPEVLTPRRAQILGLVVHEYITTAQPVSSKALASGYGLGVSAATIRSELARLEDEGYITHPHTSAGRVPSDTGYRVYVESLMEEVAVGTDEQRTITHQFHQAAGLEEWLSLAATVLAGAVGNLAVVTRPRRRVAHLRQVQFVHLVDATVLVIVVVDDGRVRERIVTLAEPTRQEEMARLAERLNAQLAEGTAENVRAAVAPEDSDVSRLLNAVASLLEEYEGAEDTFVHGIQDVLAQPEFSTVDRMLEAVRHLEAYELRRALPRPDELGGATQVLIGRENEVSWMQAWSVIVAGYGAQDGAAGTVAVVGPSRMEYARALPRVRYLATLLTEVLRSAGA